MLKLALALAFSGIFKAARVQITSFFLGFTLVLYDVTSFIPTCKFLAPPSRYTCVSFMVSPFTFLPWIIHKSCSQCSGVPAAFHHVQWSPEGELPFVFFLTSSSSFCVNANIIVLMLTLACTSFLHLQPGLCADAEQNSEIFACTFLWSWWCISLK